MLDVSNLDRHDLSRRARRLLASPPTADYLREHFVRSVSPYDPRGNPDGYIPMCIAENRLVWDLLEPRMAVCRDVPHQAICYDSMIGSAVFRARLARFLADRVLRREVVPEQVAVLAGAGSVLEILFFCLADPGDAVLIPTPSYAGFWPDLETRDELAIVPVHCSAEDGFRITVERLEQARRTAGRPVRALLFTSPSNPLGTVFSPDELEAVLDWAEGVGIHVVFDEIYALSVFGDRPFTSCGELRARLGERVHVVWAFSKDFGASGLRCGVLVSENEAALAAVDSLAYWACCSGDTQHLLAELIADEGWVDRYVGTMTGRLRAAYGTVTSVLDRHEVPFLPSGAGFFLLLDLRRFLPEPGWAGERRLWRRLLERANVNLTPGEACRVGEPGFMRLCFASVPPDHLAVGLDRLVRALEG